MEHNQGRLEGKVAVLTGAGSGIGRATAILFAQEGAKVVVSDINEKGLKETTETIEENKGEVYSTRADISNSAQVRGLMEAAVSRYGTVDVLFNCAGIWHAGDNVTADVSEEVWNSLIAVDLTGQFLCCKYVLPIMVRNRKGSIINISSTAGTTSSLGTHAYAAAKGGILSLTKSIAASYGPHNIRANVICPGPIKTPMQDTAFVDRVKEETFLKGLPLGRFGQPVEIARYAVYLASDESAFTTGTVLPIDGGLTIGFFSGKLLAGVEAK